nr:unnamed protein product [Callosobruchus analis]
MSSDVNICQRCDDNFIVNTKHIKCGLCTSKYHTSCVSVKDTWLKIFSECENLTWLCNDCKSSQCELAILKKDVECLRREKQLLAKLLSELEYTNNLQKSVIEKCQSEIATLKNRPQIPSNTSNGITYSDVVKKPKMVESSVLLIKPANGRMSSDDLLKEVTSSINPAALNIQINSTRKTKDGIAVHCKNDSSLTTLKNGLSNKFGQKYNIIAAQKFNPRLVLKDVHLSETDTAEDIVDDILKLNDIEDEHRGEVKFITKLSYSKKTNIIIEVLPTMRKLLLERRFLHVGWGQCEVEDHIRIVRCDRCGSFGHKENVCKADQCCPKCSDSHTYKECKSDILRCINCIKFNKTYKKNVPTDHSSNYGNCPCRLNYVNNIQQNIKYE